MFESKLNAGRMFQNFAKRWRKGWRCIWSLVSWGKTEGFKLIHSGGLSLIIHLIFLKLSLSLLNSAHTHNSNSNTNTVSVVSDQCFVLNHKHKEIFQIFDTSGRNLKIKVINIHHIVHVFHNLFLRIGLGSDGSHWYSHLLLIFDFYGAFCT